MGGLNQLCQHCFRKLQGFLDLFVGMTKTNMISLQIERKLENPMLYDHVANLRIPSGRSLASPGMFGLGLHKN